MVYLFADVSKKVILISLNIEVPLETWLQTSFDAAMILGYSLDVLLKTRLQTSIYIMNKTYH